MTQTITGKYTLATEWIKSGTIKSPEKLVAFLKSGDVEQLTEDQFKDQMLIRSENEELQRGELPICALYDMHPMHILDHKSLASDPDFRNDPVKMDNLNAHLQEHIDNHKNMDPDIAAMLGMAPLTGIPLTFISQGGSAMMVSLASAGVLLNISRRQVRK